MFLNFYILLIIFAFSNFTKGHEIVYLEDLEIFNTYKILKSLTTSGNSTECKQSNIEYLNGLKKKDLWALTMLDSSAKIPDGILAGNLKFLGHFDECVGVEHPNGSFTGQHCMLDVTISIPGNRSHVRTIVRPLHAVAFAQDIVMPLAYGICVPSTCSSIDIVSALKGLLDEVHIPSDRISVSLDENNCRTNEPIPWTDGDWAVIGILIAFVVVALCSSIYDVFKRFYQKIEKPHPILTSFSLYTNCQQLFSISEASSQLKCLHGLRFFSMCWVVLAHSFSVSLAIPSVNSLDLTKLISDVNHTFIVNGYVSVDTFFFLSGLLACFVFFRDVSKKKYYDVPLAYIHRYIRLTPAFGVTILIQATIFRLMGDGPYWHFFSELGSAPCRENWWSGLLYVQNFATPKSECLGQSWYLSTDMQLFWLSPLVLYPILFFPIIAPTFLLVLILAVTFTDFAIAYVHELGPSSFFTKNGDQDAIEYIHFYTRAVPYLAGIGLGYVFCGIQVKKIKIQLTNFWVFVGWLTSTGLCLGALYGIVPFTDYEWTDVEAAFYLSFHRVAWSLGLTWIVFACVQGYGSPINSFLSWNVFQPLGKLSYCVYLLHTSFMLYRAGSIRTSINAGDLELTYFFLGDLVLSYLLAIPFTLLFEMPFGNIDRYLFQNVSIFPFPKNKIKIESEKNNDLENNNNSVEKVAAVETGEGENSSKSMD